MNDMPTPPSNDGSPADSASPDSSGTAGSQAGGAQYSSQQRPHYGPQPYPGPAYQPYGEAQPGPRDGSTRRFFNSLRGSGLMRTNERWVAGVAGGVAHRFGLDPILVRCVWVVLSIFSGIGLVLYGVAWALLPEESDGRIHLEEALSGRFNAGLAGAIGMTIVGMSTIGDGFIPGWYIGLWGLPGIAAPVWTLFWLGLTLLAVVFAVRFAQNRRGGRGAPHSPQGPQPWQAAQQNASQAPGSRTGDQTGQAASPTTSDSSTSSTSYAPGSSAPAFGRPTNGPTWQNRSYRQYQPHQPTPAPVRPQRARRPGPGSSVSLAVLGLAFLAGAGIWYATATHRVGLLQGQFFLIGILVALLGAGIVVSGLRRRHGGWMTFLGWPALLVMAIPALMVASVTPPSLARMPFGTITDSATFASTTVTWKELSSSASGGSVTRNKDIGDLTLDLRGMPADEAGRLSTINAHLDVGRLRVKTDADQPVTIKTDVDMGSVEARVSRAWTVNGRQMEPDEEGPATYDVNGKTTSAYANMRGGLNIKSTLTSSGSGEGRQAITINASVDTGAIEVTDQDDSISWHGNADESVWIVSYWSDEHGGVHRGSLPIPGMSHQAITVDDATACIRSARESADADDRSQDANWRDLSDLTSKERTSYDACVQKALDGESAAGPSTAPSGTAAPAPSQTPTEQQAPAEQPPADAG
ncbi:PspC domain protein [Actinomyces johnsonii F0542]|uniref:PspC domain protein n=1 Tax=Actinomyces johnsonii F0542 TaxID=1321818 RepID=U1RUF5_9ACTO|nr:PspC domain-containing protein [Actinomyces johnsonii]ERH22067.1 PspC domain protein [Actinomyces johnsonii F0542]